LQKQPNKKKSLTKNALCKTFVLECAPKTTRTTAATSNGGKKSNISRKKNPN
jgi:hypothetical protein